MKARKKEQGGGSDACIEAATTTSIPGVSRQKRRVIK